MSLPTSSPHLGKGGGKFNSSMETKPTRYTCNPENYTDLRKKAHALRHRSTEAETVVWEIVRANRLGSTFRRQHPIWEYIVGFVSLEKKLVVEIDGEYHLHQEQVEEDRKRQRWLEENGYKVIRFTNKDCLTNKEKVTERILVELK